MESLDALAMKSGVEVGVKTGSGVEMMVETPQKGRMQDSPSGADWFMAPRKGGIGKA